MNSLNCIFEKERHEVVCSAEWDVNVVNETVSHILDESNQAFSEDNLWPHHPLLHQVPQKISHLYDDNFDPEIWFSGIYSGACGVILGINYILKRCQFSTIQINTSNMIDVVKSKYFEQSSGHITPSYFFGDSGIYFSDWLINKNQASYLALLNLVEQNVDLPSNELFWGTPGLMLVCLHMYSLSSDDAWIDSYKKMAQKLWDGLTYSEQYDCSIWVQDLDNCHVKHIGAAHGFCGNIHALLKGAQFLDLDLKHHIEKIAVSTLKNTSIKSGDFINWKQSIEGHRPERTAHLMQWCHGAPGVVTSLDYLSSADIDSLLKQAAETVWAAGPLRKSTGGLCHGAAGNGYVFLSLYARTHDEIWLQRARKFAMHSINQLVQNRETYGQYKYSLWTGDIGTACFLVDCMVPNHGIPTLDKV